MTNTEQLARQVAYELQINIDTVTVTGATPDLSTVEIINTYLIAFKRKNGDRVTAEIKDGDGYAAIYATIKTASAADGIDKQKSQNA